MELDRSSDCQIVFETCAEEKFEANLKGKF